MNCVNVHLAFVMGAPLKDYECSWVEPLKGELAPEFEKGRLAYKDDPAEADVIVLLESSLSKDPRYLKALSRDSNINKYWSKVFTINYEDAPMGFLQGLYTSICAPYYRKNLHRSWPPLWVPCSPIYEVSDEQIHARQPKFLFSFLGSQSHPLRREILSLYASSKDQETCVQDVDKWFNHSEDEKTKYVGISLDSRFVLCPRGHAPFTYRICETMALGRVPVVIADDWVPFSFADPQPYYVQIPESNVAQIPAILRESSAKAEEYGFNARALWNKYSAPKTRVNAALTEIIKLKHAGTGAKTYQECAMQWNTRTVLRQGGWTLEQRVARKFKRLMQRVRSRFGG